MFRITGDPSSRSLVHAWLKLQYDSIVSVDMDVVGVMAPTTSMSTDTIESYL